MANFMSETPPEVTDANTAHREAVRATLKRIDPALLAFIDSARSKFTSAQLVGLKVKTDEGIAGVGIFAPSVTAGERNGL